MKKMTVNEMRKINGGNKSGSKGRLIEAILKEFGKAIGAYK